MNRYLYWKSNICCTCGSFQYIWMAGRNQITITVMKLFTRRIGCGQWFLNVDWKQWSLSVPDSARIFLPINGINSHFQFVCFNEGIVGVRDLPCFCKNFYTCAIYHRPKPGKDCTLSACIHSATKKGDFKYRKFSCKMVIGQRETQEFVSLRETRKILQRKYLRMIFYLLKETQIMNLGSQYG